MFKNWTYEKWARSIWSFKKNSKKAIKATKCDAVKIEGVWENDVSNFNCDPSDNCIPRYMQRMYVPEFLFAEIESQVLQEAFATMKVPVEDADDKQNINRT